MNMIRSLCNILLIASIAVAGVARAEDTDIFLADPNFTGSRPNVLILLDNTANWNTPFTAEISALQAVVNATLSPDYNVGLMMFTETGGSNTGNDGGYVRVGVRRMCDGVICSPDDKDAFANLISHLDKLADKSNGGKLGKTMYEAYLYFNGGAAYAGATKVKRDYPGNTNAITGTTTPLPVDNPVTSAFLNSSTSTYISPILDPCAKNFIIYISNGPAQDNTADTTTATTQLASVGGNTATIPLNPNGSQSNVGDEWARFLANNDVNTSPGNPGIQTVTTYTIDVLPATTGQGPGWSALLNSMAVNGNGKYYAESNSATLQADLQRDLGDIFHQLQAVNSVFAASTLPVSVNVRGSYLNQVYMGVFRPDAKANPRWFGNLKEYQIGYNTNTSTAYLADSNNIPALDATSGFLVPGAVSYWTSSSTFWNYKPSGTPPSGSDSPDGSIVEKGAAAQRLRTTTSSGEPNYTFNSTNRNLYTCTGTCTIGISLSATPFNATNVTQAALGASSPTEQTSIIKWVLGQDVNDENGNKITTDVRPSIHGDVIHSRPAAINYGGSTGVVLFYGDDDGVFHAVQGGQSVTNGNELWGFVPKEFFPLLKRQYNNSPAIDVYPTPEPRANPVPYFVDGPVGVYRYDANNDGQITTGSGDKVYIYLTMRRGGGPLVAGGAADGRFIYALDVTNPNDPKLLWKKSNADYPEMGETWSVPQVAQIKASSNPVVIFGAGYDPNANDSTVNTPTNTMGRGVFILDATNGNKVWMFGHNGDKDPGMTFSVAADVTVIDRNGDGYADRLYAVDVGGNIWRFDIDDANTANWVANLFAVAEPCDSNNVCVTGYRRFLFPPDVVFAYSGRSFDAVLIGSGDREHPFDTSVTNRFYMFEDTNTGVLAPGTTLKKLSETDLYDTTSNLIQVGSQSDQQAAQNTLNGSKGWYVTFAGLGEKAVGSSLTINGTTYFNTNMPTPPGSGVCTANLGAAHGYALNFLNGSATIDFNKDNQLTTADRYQNFPGGGLVPSPVYFSVQIGTNTVSGPCSGVFCSNAPGPTLGNRFRNFWYQEIDK